ncbi:MAG: GNAT family N-acetyltransferase [Sphingomonadaceae bacterium]|nr:GNAT family N-acetyltransferase [Sphingomonadaceae bacterium]
MGRFRICEDDLSGPEIAALLDYHLAEMRRHSPEDSVHALPVERLREADVTFYSAWDGDGLAGCGALKQLDADHGELKSMRAAPEYRGKGAGEATLIHLIEVARSRGYRRLSLETGRPEPFRAAQSLYRKYGFEECPRFADYADNPFSICMTRQI